MPGEKSSVIDVQLSNVDEEMVAWRHDFHRHPELAFKEARTSETVQSLLRSFGLEVTAGLAGTGVVGTLSNGDGPSIGLRADMDALPIHEQGQLPYRSSADGIMHACGHDGHMAMLLGAAKRLAATRNFRGTVQFIFQPAEENEAGGKAMVDDGLFERFPVDAIYGMHNWPGLEEGRFDVCSGPIMGAFDTFEIRLAGLGTHAAMPHLGRDCLLAAANILTSLQAIVARAIDPLSAAVVSVTQLFGGDTWNVIPGEATLRGCTRSLRSSDQDRIEAEMARIADNVAKAHDVVAHLDYQRRYPATVNSETETVAATRAAADVVGAAMVGVNAVPSLVSEDFSFMLQKRPGCYIRLGTGPAGSGRLLHTSNYDFNDAILPIGAAYWTRLVERELPA